MCRQKKRGGGGGAWGSYMKWDLQISTKPVMGSCGWRGHWGAVDFPSWDRDIITLRVATQKSPSSVPWLVSANYKTQWMTFTQGKENLCCFVFFSFGCRVIHRGIIWVRGLLSHPLITTHDYSVVKTYQKMRAIFCTWWDDPVFMGLTLTETYHKVCTKQSVNKEITVLMNLFKMPAVMLCILHWLLPHRNLPQPSFILPHSPQRAMCRTLKHCNSWWLSQLACVADISRLSTSVSSPIP